MFTTPVRLFDMKLLSSHALWKFLVPVISLFECVVHVHENQCYKVGCSVKACLLAGMLTSSSVQVCCWFAYIQWTIDDLLIFWILNALLREKGMHSIPAFKVFVAVYHRLLFSLCLFQTFSMEIFSFHASSAMNLTWCSTSARFTRSLFFAIAGRLLGLELNG